LAFLYVRKQTVYEILSDDSNRQESELKTSYIGDLIKANHFHLYERAYHVFIESQLVQKFARVSHDASLLPEAKAQMLGQLMNKSHEGCRDNFDCSCLELNKLTTIAKYGHIACDDISDLKPLIFDFFFQGGWGLWLSVNRRWMGRMHDLSGAPS